MNAPPASGADGSCLICGEKNWRRVVGSEDLEYKCKAGTWSLVECARCGGLIAAGEPWDLDHKDDRRGYLGPSHSACNRATQKPRRRSRVW